MELWKPVKDYEGKYEVSNQGRIKSVRFNRLLKTHPSVVNGEVRRMRVCFVVKGVYDWCSLARVVYEAFVRELAEHERLVFVDGDSTNCVVDNLAVNTTSAIDPDELAQLCATMTLSEIAEYYNIPYVSARGKVIEFGLEPYRKWSDEELARISELTRTHTQTEIAEMYDTTQQNIANILRYHDVDHHDQRLVKAEEVIRWPEEVDRVRELAKRHTQVEIAKMYNTSASNIWQVFQRYNISSQG